MLKTIEHSYACSILQKNGIEIYRDGNRILDQKYPFTFPKLKTFIKVGENFALPYLDKKVEKIGDYDYLKKLGWKVSKREAIGEFFDYQRKAYFLSPMDSKHPDYGAFPLNHYVLIDLANQLIQFIGENVSLTGHSGWLPLNPKKRERIVEKKANPFQINKIMEIGTEMFQNRLPDSFQSSQKESLKEIPEAVIGITKNGEICCLEDTDEAPTISISGQKGSGKSMTENNIEGQIYNKFGYNIFNFNDVKYDTQTRNMPWDKDHKFYKELLRFNEPSIPLPYIYLYPAFKNIKEEKILYKDEVGFEVSFSFKDFLLDSNLMKYNPSWETSPASRKYIRNLIQDNEGNERIDGLLYLKNLEEVQDLIDKSIPEDVANLKVAIYNLIKDVWARNILDKTTKINSKWTMKFKNKSYEYHPWNICLLANLIPSFITADARNYDWFPMWLKHILESVFEFVESTDYKKLQGKKIMLCGDELVQILRNKSTTEIIDLVIREGRTKYVGWMQCVQYFKDIPDSIIANITHYLVFNTQAKSDVDYLKNKFVLTKTQQEELGKLKQFQCMAFGDYILYDVNGSKNSNEGEPVKIIKIKPPNAQHFGGYKLL